MQIHSGGGLEGPGMREKSTRSSRRIEPGSHQESVWDYPRPPALQATPRKIEIWHEGVRVASTERALRVLETSHPPVYYIPPHDVRMDLVRPGRGSSVCEWKGRARYFDLQLGDVCVRGAAWAYPDPVPAFAELRDHLAFYPSRVERCLVDGEVVEAQPGDFYGGWITADIVGPFKGSEGTRFW